jgi:hypothetical protein
VICLIRVLGGKIREWTQEDGAVGENASLVGERYYVGRSNRFHEGDGRANSLSTTVDEQRVDTSAIVKSGKTNVPSPFCIDIQRLNSRLAEIAIDFVVGQLTPIRQLQDLWIAFRFRHLLELGGIRAESCKWLRAGRRRMDQERSSQPIVELSPIMGVVPIGESVRQCFLKAATSYPPVLSMLQWGISICVRGVRINWVLPPDNKVSEGSFR